VIVAKNLNGRKRQLRTALTQLGLTYVEGLRPLAVGALGELAIAGITLAMLLGADRVFGI
jgi:hypothetical protein